MQNVQYQHGKSHFLTGLCTLHPTFPLHVRDRLTVQSVTSLNLLRPCRQNPNLSAYAALNGNFNYNATPLAPPGCKVVMHKNTTKRKTFAPHGSDAYYIGPAMHHYQYYKVYVSQTCGEHITDTISFHLYLCQTPCITPLDNVLKSATGSQKLYKLKNIFSHFMKLSKMAP